MKNNLAIIAALLFTTTSFFANAQTSYHHEINLGYGYVTKEQVHNGFLGFHKNYLGLSEQEMILDEMYEGSGVRPYINDLRKTGVIALSYKYAITKRIKAGLTIAAENEHADVYSLGQVQSGGNYRRTAISIAAEGKFIYTTNGLVSLYGLAGFGTCVIRQKITGNEKTYKSTSNYFTLQLSPIGLRIGKKAAGFLEAGFGYKGVCHLGFSYQL